MNLLNFFNSHPVFTRKEYVSFLQQIGTTNQNTQRELLAYHIDKKHIIRIRQSLFATIPTALENSIDGYPIDPY